MERCVRCGISENNARLFDAVYLGRMEVICERCSIVDNIPLLKKPSTGQLKDSESEVSKRMRSISGLEKRREDVFFPEDRLKELDNNPELELPERDKIDLIEHYHWEIMKNRRRRGWSIKQLANSIGEGESSLEMIEKGKLVEDAERIIKKLEQLFQVRLRNLKEKEMLSDKPILLDVEGNELEVIPEEEIKYDIDDEEDIPIKVHDVNIREVDVERIKIGDLQRIHKKKIVASKQEMREEQKRIKEGEQISQMRKEELKSIKEKEKRELDEMMGGLELLYISGKDDPIVIEGIDDD